MAIALVKKTHVGTALNGRIDDLSARANSHGLTDTYAAERLAEYFGCDLRYDHQRKSWFVYRDHLWRLDRDGEVERLAIECAGGLEDEARRIADSSTRGKVLVFCKHCQSLPGIRRVLGIAENLAPLATTGEQWNRNPLLAGTPNGVIDLATGKSRKGQREDLISLSLGVPYAPDADCPRWKRFVGEVFGGDRELAEYLQRVLGYTLTGLTSEQAWWLLFGEGANGKTTLLTVVAQVLGDYAKTVPFSMFELQQRSAVPDDIATLVGRRYVTASESIEAAHLHEARMKGLTGGDRQTARPLYGKWFEFDPQLKLFLSCNHKPKVTDDSHGFWRRVHVLPFTQQFAGKRKDDHLVDTLKAEGSGVLNWMLEGCLRWQADGLMHPATVLSATLTYESESNPTNDFVAECCVQEAGVESPAQELYAAYTAWTRGNDGTPVTMTAFGKWMSKRFAKHHRNVGNVYKGLRLRS